MKKYMIGLLVTNKYGVLTRIASLFARRGYNIDTLTVGGNGESAGFSYDDYDYGE